MLAGVFQSPGVFAVQECPMPILQRDDDVLLQVRACGICGTDLHILSVPPGIPVEPGSILGHEYTATVVQVGAGVVDLQPGDTVVVDPSLTCGACAYCRMGLPNSCRHIETLGVTRNGGLAQYSVVPARTLHKIHADVPAHLAALAEPLACVVHGAEKVKFQPGESALILGAGPIGLMFTQFFRAAGAADILVSEVSSVRAQVALENGADRVINPQTETVAVDLAVDAVGSLFDIALQSVRRGGRILLFGVNQHARAALAQYNITRGEISVYGSWIAKDSFPRAIHIIESGRLPLEKLVTRCLPLRDAPAAIEAMRRGEGIKIQVLPNAE
ncbi:MAG: alcohol dehydrogenase catalytic domain-containing protein [Chloroflexi bacterium]|nr:alcohol dehydrogenase catalytic domain-containing protein [Chloroflexota bacterium]